ncbi:hypothetical protein M2475_001637 [Breznakia sp. PF5-3]|uniref:hypothetical protein n=1 Tax=unclassified Breznakia TaxID=2623764 RepID=UPI0024068A8F|nr:MULTISPECIES: hypothetical protein [unclassified Breznakia]MDF9825203.1 hypothetical protein [Breznakia sp. PM6-1]MDF9836061.1 hypothetical protein [Breznakia sp. PF5-3]MDF9838877.1 hypothetical protein [Breznakia sp. PFB2-8]MDF9860903.1 hypothetical protein [Breznakia sp. PH5-24]
MELIIKIFSDTWLLLIVFLGVAWWLDEFIERKRVNNMIEIIKKVEKEKKDLRNKKK